MDGQRHSSSRRRKSKRSRAENKPNGQTRAEPILIAARRPNAPAVHPTRRFIAASAAPRKPDTASGAASVPSPESVPGRGASAGSMNAVRPRDSLTARVGAAGSTNDDPARRRGTRIVQVQATGPDEREKLRLKLVERLLRSEGRVAITHAAREFVAAGFDFPIVQDVQLQLLEHFDEACAHQAICHLTELLNDEAPIKRPLFEQRLRRLEEDAEDAETREAAAELRRTVRA